MLSLQPKEQEIIEAEIIEADIEVLSDEKRFLEFIENSLKIPNDLKKNEMVRNITAGNYYEKIVVKGDATFGGGSTPK
jgi:hypothetical protein